MLYISNAFSLSMIPTWRLAEGAKIVARAVPDPLEWLAEAESRHLEAQSVIGHADMAALFSRILHRTLAVHRISLALSSDDELLVGQYSGPRLPEGTTELPAWATITWLAVAIEP